MTKVCKSDYEETVVGTRGNGEVAPIPFVRKMGNVTGDKIAKWRCYSAPLADQVGIVSR
jgi:hypothetical protein